MLGLGIRLLVVFIAAFIQVAVISVFSYDFYAPNLLLIMALAWTLARGYSNIFPWLIVMGLIADILFFQTVGASVVLFIFVGYIMSFLTRHFLVGHRVWASVSLVGFVILASLLYLMGLIGIISLYNNFNPIVLTFDVLTLREILFGIVTNIAFFSLSYWILKKLEYFLSFYERHVSPKRYI